MEKVIKTNTLSTMSTLPTTDEIVLTMAFKDVSEFLLFTLAFDGCCAAPADYNTLNRLLGLRHDDLTKFDFDDVIAEHLSNELTGGTQSDFDTHQAVYCLETKRYSYGTGANDYRKRQKLMDEEDFVYGPFDSPQVHHILALPLDVAASISEQMKTVCETLGIPHMGLILQANRCAKHPDVAILTLHELPVGLFNAEALSWAVLLTDLCKIPSEYLVLGDDLKTH